MNKLFIVKYRIPENQRFPGLKKQWMIWGNATQTADENITVSLHYLPTGNWDGTVLLVPKAEDARPVDE